MNPHNVIDGKWGGWGPSYWLLAGQFDFAKRDVVERRRHEGALQWWRIWVDVDQKWRDLTAEEITRLPVQ